MGDYTIDATTQFLFSALSIVVAGTYLAKASDRIAEITGLGRLFAGSILLAGATSMPELLVDISAIRKGMPDLAVGDLLGSSLMNLLILAVADLLHRNPRKMLSRAGAQHALSAAMSINLTAIAGVAIFLGPQLQSFGVGAIGIGPLAIGAVYILGLRLVYYDQQAKGPSLESSVPSGGRPQLARAISVYLACAVVIFIAAPFMAASAGEIADRTGLSKSFVGTTLVAFCTSLPEVVSTIAAVRMGAFDLAVGNIFGSNSFNMLLLLPLDWFQEGNLLSVVSRSHILIVLAVILATSVAVMGQLYHEEKRKQLIEPDAVAVMTVVFGALFLLFWSGAS